MKIINLKHLIENIPNEAELTITQKGITDASNHYSQATVELVDNAAGIYAADTLVARNNLFDCSGELFSNARLREELHPDNREYCENIDHYFYETGIYAKDSYGILWRCEFWEGDIICVHPNAEWNDDLNAWELG